MEREKVLPRLVMMFGLESMRSIVGGIKVENDVMIAPGAFVNRDVPSHSVVFGNPCIIKHKDHATEGYINHKSQ